MRDTGIVRRAKMSNYDYSRFEEEEKEEIIKEVLEGIVINDIALKHNSCDRTIRNILYKYGFSYDKKQSLWINDSLEESKEAIYIMNNVDIENEIGEISKKRYYERYINQYPDNIENENKKEITIYSELFKEVKNISEKYGCDSPDELVELILLRFVSKNNRKDESKKFRKKYLMENGFDEIEADIYIGCNKDNDICDIEGLIEDDSLEEAQALISYYKQQLKDNNIQIGEIKSNLNLFEYYKNKYDEMKRGSNING